MYPNLLDLIVWAQQPGRPGMPPGFGPGPGGRPVQPSSGDIATILALMAVPLIIGLVMMIFMMVCQWKIFTKAGEPGWAALVPIYNVMILSKICGRGEMFGLLVLVPCVNIIVAIMLTFDLARVFGKDTGFAIGLLLLGIVFVPILAFGSAQYVGAGSRGGKARRRRDDDEDEDEDDRPRRRRPVDDDDDAPRRPAARDDRLKRPEDRTKPRRPADDDDEDEPRPRRKRADD